MERKKGWAVDGPLRIILADEKGMRDVTSMEQAFVKVMVGFTREKGDRWLVF